VRVTLRPVADSDLGALFEWEREPVAVQMAAFCRPDPSDRASFDAHYRRVRTDPLVTLRAVVDERGLVGTVASFTVDGDREVSYWIDPARWGEGLASTALSQFLRVEATRPLFARVAAHNTGSAKVLVRAGFRQVGFETSFANGVGSDIVEYIYELAR